MNKAFCKCCGEVVFESLLPIRVSQLSVSRIAPGVCRWWSSNFKFVVHQCGVDVSSLVDIKITDSEPGEPST